MDVRPPYVIKKIFWVRAILALMDVISKGNICYIIIKREVHSGIWHCFVHSIILIPLLTTHFLYEEETISESKFLIFLRLFGCLVDAK